ncbi:MAG: hypothetical protein IPJ13_23765 [Saprospiraceae bacterium]|nr:hypothetical protein [Saprospiraceae bacterium]
MDQGQLFNRVLTMVSTVAGVQVLLLEFMRRMECKMLERVMELRVGECWVLGLEMINLGLDLM